MAEENEVPLKTSRLEDVPTISSPCITGREDDDDAVISMLEVPETGHRGIVDSPDEKSDTAKVPSSPPAVNSDRKESANMSNQHTSTHTSTSDTLGHSIWREQPSGYAEDIPLKFTDEIKHVRSIHSTSIPSTIGKVPSQILEAATDLPLLPVTNGTTSIPHDEHASHARCQKHFASGDCPEKYEIVTDSDGIPEEAGASKIVVTAPENEGDLSSAPALPSEPGIFPTNSKIPDSTETRVEDEGSMRLFSSIHGDATVSLHPSDITSIEVSSTHLPGAYIQPFIYTLSKSTSEDRHAINCEPPPTSVWPEFGVCPGAANTLQPSTSAEPLMETSNHCQISGLPTALPGSPREERSQSITSVPLAEDTVDSISILSASASDTNTPINHELTAASSSAVELSASNLEDSASPIAAAELIISTATSDLTMPDDNAQFLTSGEERALLVPDFDSAAPEPSNRITSQGPASTDPPLHPPTDSNATITTSSPPSLPAFPGETLVSVTESEKSAPTNIDANKPSPFPTPAFCAPTVQAHTGVPTADSETGTNVAVPEPDDAIRTSQTANTFEGCFNEHNNHSGGGALSGPFSQNYSDYLADMPPPFPVPSTDALAGNVEANAFYRIVGDSSTRCIDQADDELVQAEDIHLSDERSFGDPPSPVLPPSSPPTSQISVCNLFNSAPVLAQEDEREASQSADLPELQEGLTREKMNLSDALPPSSPVLFSSQPRASSPDRIFDSSPPDWARVSPLTSPQLFPAIDDKEDTLERSFSLDTDSISDDHGAAGSIVLGKRKVEDEETESSMDQKRAKLEEGITLPPPPNPKRPTQASQKKQYRKLVKPFRSPLVNIEDVLAGKDAVYASGHARSRTPDVHSAKGGASSISKSPLKEEQLGTTHLTAVTANKDRTAKVAKPFRAPSSMSLPASISVTAHTTSFSSSSSASGVHAAPTIQTLQARVQKLKQAIKIKEDRVQGGDDDKLEVLAGKWKSVGREVAWLVWDTVRDLEPGKTVGMLPAKGGWDEGENPFGGGGNGRVKRVGGGEGWGYDGGKGGGGSGWGISSGWGWDEKGEQGEGEEGAEGMEVEEDEQEVPEHTLGTMLRHMGIDPETLGWDEDEGDFVGDA